MGTNELTGFAKVLADWTEAVTRLTAYVEDMEPHDNASVLLNIEDDLRRAAAVFETLMGVDDPVPPEAGRVLFCATPQLGNVIGRTVGNGDARFDVRLASGYIITVPADFIGGEATAMRAWAEQRGRIMRTDNAMIAYEASPDRKR